MASLVTSLKPSGRVDFPKGMLDLIGVRPGDFVDLFLEDRSIAVMLRGMRLWSGG